MNLATLALVLSVVLPAAPANRIHDEAGLLTGDGLARVEHGLQSVRSRANVTLGVITLSNLDEDPQAVAIRAISQWNLGARSAVLLVSMNPKKIFIQPGQALAANFPRSVCENIAKNVIAPRLRSGDFTGGVISGLEAITTRAEIRSAVHTPVTLAVNPETYDSKLSTGQAVFIFLAVAAFLTFVLVVIRRAMREAKADREREADARRELAASRRKTAAYSPPPGYATNRPAVSAPAPAQTVVVQNQNNDLLTGVLIGEAISRPYAAPAPRYSPPAPSYSPPEPSGGGSDWGSSSSSGGGSDFSSDFGGGSSFDSGSSGGGSDW